MNSVMINQMGAPQVRLPGPSMAASGIGYSNPSDYHGSLGPRADIEAAFGSPSNGGPTMVWGDHQRRDHSLLPDAYRGPNRHVARLVIVGLARINAGTVFAEIAPLRYQNGLRQITYQVTKYHDTTWNAEPEEGVATFASKSSMSWTASAFRIAKAFRMEHGFALTPEGREDYMASMLQMTCGLRDRIEISILHELRNPPVINDPTLRASRESGFAFTASTLTDRMRLEAMAWGIVQKGTRASYSHSNNMRILMHMILEQFRKNGSTGSGGIILLVPQGTKHLVGLFPSEYASKEESGALGVSIKDSGNMLGREASLAGIRVVEIANYPMEENTEPVNPLVDSRLIGEFYLMCTSRLNLSPGQRISLRDMDICIMDYQRDQVRRVTYQQAFTATGIFHRDGTYNDRIADLFFNNSMTLGAFLDAFNGWGPVAVPGRARNVARNQRSQRLARASLTAAKMTPSSIRGGERTATSPFGEHFTNSLKMPTLVEARAAFEQTLRDNGHVTPIDAQFKTAFALAIVNVPRRTMDVEAYLNACELPGRIGNRYDNYVIAGDIVFGNFGVIQALIADPAHTVDPGLPITSLHQRLWMAATAHPASHEAQIRFLSAIAEDVAGKAEIIYLMQHLGRNWTQDTTKLLVMSLSQHGRAAEIGDLPLFVVRPDAAADWLTTNELRGNYDATTQTGKAITEIGIMFGSIHAHIENDGNNKYKNLNLWRDIIIMLSNNLIWATYPLLAYSCVLGLGKIVDDASNGFVDESRINRLKHALRKALESAKSPVFAGEDNIYDKPLKELTQDELLGAMEAGHVKIFNITLIRNKMLWRMATFIATKPGSMATYFGDANFMLGADVNHKMLLGHATAYTAAAVEHPEDIVHIPNALFIGYDGGASTVFHDPTNRTHIERCNGDFDPADYLESMFAIPLRPGEEMNGTMHFDITGAPPSDLSSDGRELGETPAMMPHYAALWGFRHTKNYGPNDYSHDGINSCFVTRGWSVMKIGQDLIEDINPTGWIGNRCYSGMREHLIGAYVMPPSDLKEVVSTATLARAFNDDSTLGLAY